MKVVVNYFCNLLTKKKQLTPHPLSTLLTVFLVAEIELNGKN